LGKLETFYFVLVPVGHGNHWSLLIICWPSTLPGEVVKGYARPFILHACSMGHSASTLKNTVLPGQKGGKTCYTVRDTLAAVLHLHGDVFNVHELPVPKQERGSNDCGWFCMGFIKRFVEMVVDREASPDAPAALQHANQRSRVEALLDANPAKWFDPVTYIPEARQIMAAVIVQFVLKERQAAVDIEQQRKIKKPALQQQRKCSTGPAYGAQNLRSARGEPEMLSLPQWRETNTPILDQHHQHQQLQHHKHQHQHQHQHHQQHRRHHQHL
jgi:hypothetical protein